MHLNNSVCEYDVRTIAGSLVAALDPASYLESLKIEPYTWQREALNPSIRRLILLAARQAGKSTVVAGKAIHKTKYNNNFLSLIICPAKEQSKELIKKIDQFIIEDLELPELVHDSVFEKEFANGSRIVALPGTERSVRSYSSPGMIIIDESARVLEETYQALRPMMTAADTELILMSTGQGRRGFFYREWEQGTDWTKIEVNCAFRYQGGKLVDAMPEEEYRGLQEKKGISAYYSPRHTREFLERERASSPMPEYWMNQEYFCQFVQNIDAVFRYDLVEKIFSSDVKPLYQGLLSSKVRALGA